MREKAIENKIKDYLKTIPECFFWKVFSGMYCRAGIPDIIACIKGKFYGFECKSEDGKTTALQDATIKKIKEAGGIAGVVRSVDDVKRLIGGNDEKV